MKVVVRKIPEPREISRGVYELPEMFPLFIIVDDEKVKKEKFSKKLLKA